MSKLIKILVSILIASVVVLGAAGCGNKSDHEHPTGDHPSGEHPSEEEPAEEHPSSEHPSGEHPQ
jgi:uncharacterized lipoprotein YehR (DUF1307 family)